MVKLGRVSNKVKAASCTSIPPGKQFWVRVTFHKHGLYTVEPRNDLMNKDGISVPNWIVEVQESRPFFLLVSSF